MLLRIRGTDEVVEASLRYRNMGIEQDCWAWVLEVPVRGQSAPVAPPADGYEVAEASPEERDHLTAGNYTGLFS